MSRRPHLTGLVQAPAVIILILSFLLSGCATQAVLQDSSEQSARAYTELGVAYLERDNLRRAMSALDRALEADPGDAEALQAMAMVYQRQGEEQLAGESFKRALAADPTMTRARNNYAAFLYDRGRIREACQQLEQATEDTQYPNRAQLFANLGQCQRELGDLGAARTSLARAQAIDPRSARSYFILAEIEHAQGNHGRAEEQVQTYMRLAGADVPSVTLARDIARAQGDLTSAAFYSEQLDSSRGDP